MKVTKKSSVITLNITSEKQESEDALRKYTEFVNAMHAHVMNISPILSFEVIDEDQDEKGFYYTVVYETEVKFNV